MRLMVKHYDEKALRIFSKEIAQAVTGMTAGVINYMGGRPTVSPSVHLFSFLIPKNFIKIEVEINQSKSEVKMPTLPKFSKKDDVNLNGYACYDPIDTDYLERRLKAFLPRINIHRTTSSRFSFLRGIEAHYIKYSIT